MLRKTKRHVSPTGGEFNGDLTRDRIRKTSPTKQRKENSSFSGKENVPPCWVGNKNQPLFRTVIFEVIIGDTFFSQSPSSWVFIRQIHSISLENPLGLRISVDTFCRDPEAHLKRARLCYFA